MRLLAEGSDGRGGTGGAVCPSSLLDRPTSFRDFDRDYTSQALLLSRSIQSGKFAPDHHAWRRDRVTTVLGVAVGYTRLHSVQIVIMLSRVASRLVGIVGGRCAFPLSLRAWFELPIPSRSILILWLSRLSRFALSLLFLLYRSRVLSISSAGC